MQDQGKLAGSLVVGLEGPWPTAVEWSWLKKWRPSGVILFSRNVQGFTQLQKLCAVLKMAVPGLKIMADHEGGPVSQMAVAVGRAPVAYQLGVLDDVDLTRLVHAETGRRLLAAGVDWVLAPCADVLSEPRNPVIGARSFGSDPELVSRHVEAAVKGLRSAGISCCLKHWPGHGGSSTDSHFQAAKVDIASGDEMPFRAGLKAGADGIMPGHLLVSGSRWPATLSKDFLDETRHGLGKDHPNIQLIADDVSMGALRRPMLSLGIEIDDDGGAGMVEVSALSLQWFERLAEAGCDLFLIRGIPLKAFPGGAQNGKAPTWDPSIALAEIEFDDSVYTQAMRFISTDFFTSVSDDLACLDLARHDRWQVAGGLGTDHWKRWDGLWAERFGSVLRVSDLDIPLVGDGLISWLLVTNPRPMPENWTGSVWGKSLQKRLAASGQCLVMGHPSLGHDLELFLNPDWRIDSLYDVSCDIFSHR